MVFSIVFSQEKIRACFCPQVISSFWSLGFWINLITAWAIFCGWFWLTKRQALSPISLRTGISLAITGVLVRNASIMGRPKPSASEG